MNSTLSHLTCWTLTEGWPAMDHQCVGLGEAIGLTCIKQHVKARAPWKYLPPDFWPDGLSFKEHGRFEGPWPDVLISCGRRSVATAMAIRKASGGKTFTIHVQAPHVAPEKFDMIMVPRHDALRGENVFVSRGALHHVTTAKLEKAQIDFRPILGGLDHPILGVLVGGSTKKNAVRGETMRDLAEKLASATKLSGGSIALTPSRRTGKENEQVLADALKNSPAWIWDGSGENPYFGILAHADALVVTGDSVSMISEAAFTGKPLYIYDLEGSSRRMKQFHQDLYNEGIARPFTGAAIENWSYKPMDDTNEAAALIRERLCAR